MTLHMYVELLSPRQMMKILWYSYPSGKGFDSGPITWLTVCVLIANKLVISRDIIIDSLFFSAGWLLWLYIIELLMLSRQAKLGHPTRLYHTSKTKTNTFL